MTFAPTYACFGCVDFANNQRTKTYLAWACRTGKLAEAPPFNWICTCPDDDQVWTDPVTDNVCWYDPLIPESADFLGAVIVEASGLFATTYARELADSIGDGSILMQSTNKGKQIVLKVYLYATSAAGQRYGLTWLRKQFETSDRCPQDGASCSSCQGQLLTVRTHCAAGTNALDRGLHSWAAAGAIDGLSLVEDEYPFGRKHCNTVTVATVTLGTENSESYSTEPVSSTTVTTAGTFTELGNCIIGPVMSLDDVCCPICNTGCDPCTTDPGCDCLPPFVLEPEVLGATAPCFADPVCRCIGAAMITNLPAGYDSAFRMTFQSGWNPNLDPRALAFQRFGMRNAVFRIFEVPPSENLGVPTDAASYDALVARIEPCAEVGVSWMPAGTELVVDGLSGRTWLKCNGKCVDHSKRVQTISGSIFPLKARCNNIIVTVEWDCLNTQGVDDDSTILSSLMIETFLGHNL